MSTASTRLFGSVAVGGLAVFTSAAELLMDRASTGVDVMPLGLTDDFGQVAS